jgi:Ca2+-binding EF-hand superfamily protein
MTRYPLSSSTSWTGRVAIAVIAVCFAAIGAASAAPATDRGLMSLDADGNDAVSRDEFLAAVRQQFQRIDKDGSGKASMSELRDFAMKQMRGGAQDPLFSRRGRPDLSFDRNGEVDFAGFSQALVRFRFDPLDADRDRSLSATEIAADRAR